MYHKILKESGSHLSVLVVDEACEYRDLLDKQLSKYFKTFMYASNHEEVLSVYEHEKFDIVLIDIDKEVINGLEVIVQIQKVNPYQSIFVCSSNVGNTSLLTKLLNLGVSCFINKSEKLENYYKNFSKVCKQMSEQKMFMHYVTELEKMNLNPNVSNDSVQEKDIEFFQTNSAEEEEFEFFPTSSAQDDDFEFFSTVPPTTDAKVDESVYKDYFNFLDSDDREDVRDLLVDIDTTLIDAFTDSGANSDYIAQLGALFMRYGNVLINYQFFSDIGMVILELGKATSDECEKVAAEANVFHSLMGGFCSGLQIFMVEVWEKESENPKLFNDSIVNDAKFIMNIIIPPKEPEYSDDLVFF